MKRTICKIPKKTESKKNKYNVKNIKIIENNIIIMEIATFKKSGISYLHSLDESKIAKMVQQANDAYYNDSPLLTDNEFDILKEYVERKYPTNAVLKEIGADVRVSSKNKVKLPFEMASMNKIKPDSGALAGWMSKYAGPYVLSCKLDGVSGMYLCDNGGKIALYTRGNGTVGQDISHLISVLRLPKIPKGTAIRGEFILPKRVFTEKYSKTFANSRNLVSGIINKKTVDEKTRDLHFVCYEIIEPAMKPAEQMENLQKWGFRVVMNMCVKKLTNEFLSDNLLKWRKEYEYDIDGIIMSNNAIYVRQSGNPEHSVAFKMVISDQLAEAKVVDVLWEPSKDGYLKPRVQIEPIQLGGVCIEYATGFNGKFIEDNKIGVGAVIRMVRSGDVIPYIQSVTVPAEPAKMPGVSYVWNKTRVDLLLENPTENMLVQEKNVCAFFTHLEVDGLARGNVKKLFQKGFNTVAKILKMGVADFLKIDGFKEKMAQKIFGSIREKIEKADLLDIMTASGKLGRGMAEKKMRPILEMYPDILTSQKTNEEKEELLQKVNGIGKENAREFVEHIAGFLEFLRECELESKIHSVGLLNTNSAKTGEPKSGQTEHILYGKKIVMTNIRDKEAIDFILGKGGKMEDTMTRDVFVLIVRSKQDKPTKKTEYAEKNGIRIMTVEEFKSEYL